LDLHDVHFIPISALKGDNVVNHSEAMQWYEGQPLMQLLDSIEIANDQNFDSVRFPVQWVNRPNLDFRGFSGTMAGGVLRKGDPITALPSRKTSKVKSIVTWDGEVDEAFPPQAVTVTLEDEIDVSRGDMLVRPDDLPLVDSRFVADIVWMVETPLTPGRQYYIKQATKTVTGSVAHILSRTDVNTLERLQARQLKLNEIGRCEVALSAPIAFDPYKTCKGTGSFIVVDRLTNVTVGAGMIVGPAEKHAEGRKVSVEERAARFGQKPVTIWLVGEKRVEMAYRLDRSLFDLGHGSTVLEDDSLGEEAALVARYINEAGLICICALENVEPEESEASWIVDADNLDVSGLIKRLHVYAHVADEEDGLDFDI
jgi:bifunctional enzyme CysN/CysC